MVVSCSNRLNETTLPKNARTNITKHEPSPPQPFQLIKTTAPGSPSVQHQNKSRSLSPLQDDGLGGREVSVNAPSMAERLRFPHIHNESNTKTDASMGRQVSASITAPRHNATEVAAADPSSNCKQNFLAPRSWQTTPFCRRERPKLFSSPLELIGKPISASNHLLPMDTKIQSPPCLGREMRVLPPALPDFPRPGVLMLEEVAKVGPSTWPDAPLVDAQTANLCAVPHKEQPSSV